MCAMYVITIIMFHRISIPHIIIINHKYQSTKRKNKQQEKINLRNLFVKLQRNKQKNKTHKHHTKRQQEKRDDR